VSADLAAGDLHGCDSGLRGEVSLAGKPRDITYQADDLGREYRPDPEDLGKGSSRSPNLFADADVQLRDLLVEIAYVAQEIGSQLTTHRLGHRTRVAARADATEDAGCPVGGEHARDAARNELTQESVQALEDSSTLADQILAPLGEQPYGVDPIVRSYPGQASIAPGGECLEGGVQLVVLAPVAYGEHPHPRRELGWDIHHLFAARGQPVGQSPAP
jgi:hypothetical protein